MAGAADPVRELPTVLLGQAVEIAPQCAPVLFLLAAAGAVSAIYLKSVRSL